MPASQSRTDPVAVTQELQNRLEDLQKVDEELKSAQKRVNDLSSDRNGKLQQINQLRAQLNDSLNEQLMKAGVSIDRQGVIQR